MWFDEAELRIGDSLRRTSTKAWPAVLSVPCPLLTTVQI